MIVVMTETGGFAEMMCGESDCQRVRAKVRAQARAEVRVRVVVQLEMQVGVCSFQGFQQPPSHSITYRHLPYSHELSPL